MKKLCKEALLGVVMIISGLIFIIMALQLPNTESQLFDSRFMPLVTGIIMIAMGIPQIIQNYSKEVEEAKQVDNKTLLITIALLFFYVITYGRLGFVVTSAIFLFFEIINLTPTFLKKNYVMFVIISIVIPLIVYYLFYYGFRIILPAGILRGIL